MICFYSYLHVQRHSEQVNSFLMSEIAQKQNPNNEFIAKRRPSCSKIERHLQKKALELSNKK